MHRFYYELTVNAAGERVTLSPEESAHATRVLRLRPGEEVAVLDGCHLWSGLLEQVDEKAAVVAITAQLPSPEPPARASIIQGLPKAEKLELIAQKCTELGAFALCPVEMERCVAKAEKADRFEKKRERINRIMMEAAKQSGRAHVPEMLPVQSFGTLMQHISENYDLVLVAWEEEHALPLSKAVQGYVEQNGVPRRIGIVIGPEGGISQQEWQRLHDAGAVSVTLGPRILRTETAGLCALSVLWTALGEM